MNVERDPADVRRELLYRSLAARMLVHYDRLHRQGDALSLDGLGHIYDDFRAEFGEIHTAALNLVQPLIVQLLYLHITYVPDEARGQVRKQLERELLLYYGVNWRSDPLLGEDGEQ